jgi:hypothetical protein
VQGTHELVDVSLNKSPYQLTGFDLKLIFDTVGLKFQKATPSGPFGDSGWEYFDYEYSVMEGTSLGLVHLSAVMDVRSGLLPLMDSASNPVILFSLDFLVSEDRNLERAYVPIRFYWEDCDDNVITYRPYDGYGEEVRSVSKHIYDFDLIGDISADSIGFPTYTGYQRECYEKGQGLEPPPLQMLDLFNGGVDIWGCFDIPMLGDVNLNRTAFEYSDLLLFTRYFTEGLDVFSSIMMGCSIDATNVNRDHSVLSSSDWVYFIRKVFGGAVPLDSLVNDSAVCTINDGLLSVDKTVHAAQFVIVGDAQWQLRQYGLEALSHFDGFETRVLVYSTSVWDTDPTDWITFSGSIFWTDGSIRKIDMSTVDGARVDVTIVEE